MSRLPRSPLFFAAAGLLATGCADGSIDGAEAPPIGSLHAALAFTGGVHDVASMRYRVIPDDEDCLDPAAEPLDEANVALEEEALPGWLDPAAGANHAFADALFVLQPGAYKVCAAPLNADGEPSAECAPAEGIFAVIAEQTTEGVIYSQCAGDPSGGLDVVAALNDPPHIDDLDIGASKFITTCEAATITVTARDPNGDPLSYAFSIAGGPAGAAPSLDSEENVAMFASDMEGSYQVTVVVTDGVGGRAELTFPIHVSECLVVSGIQRDVPEEEVLRRGFTRCWATPYNTGGYALPDVLAECDGEELMMACRRIGEPNLLLAAEGDAAEVLLDVGPGANASHEHNGVQWYFDPTRSWGFAPAGAPINRNSCDVEGSDRDQRMCWHMNVPGAAPNEIAGGWNCGVDTFLQANSGAGWERVLFTR